jgi:hypothetical protein
MSSTSGFLQHSPVKEDYSRTGASIYYMVGLCEYEKCQTREGIDNFTYAVVQLRIYRALELECAIT